MGKLEKKRSLWLVLFKHRSSRLGQLCEKAIAFLPIQQRRVEHDICVRQLERGSKHNTNKTEGGKKSALI
ncbi:MAG TPA: hypothetical protein V6C90_04255 [Coleofasciculaceae cyanobacterium]